MTVGVVVAAPGRPERFAQVGGQLAAAGVARVHRLAGVDAAADLRAVAELAGSGTEPLLLCTADLVANDSVLPILATEPAGRTYALTSAAPGTVREERGRVTAVDAPAATTFLGALRIAVADLAVTAACCERAAQRAGPGELAPDLLLRELVASGVVVMACRIRLLHAERVAGAEELAGAVAAVAAVDDDAARLRYAVKERDDFFTTYFVSPYSPYLVRWAARRGLGPTAVTAASVVLAALAAGAFALASRPAMVAGAVLLYAGFVLDCVDGQLARYTRRFSAFGGWLDTIADRAKEYLVYAGLAAGAGGGAWWLAIAAMALQTVRHTTDTWYGLLHDEAVARRAGRGAGRGDPGGLLGRVSDRVLADAGSVAYWLKRIVVFPIGERWAAIALAAALSGGRVALTVVLVWGGLAAAYTASLRGLRSLRMRVPVLTTVDIARQRDDGPLVRRLLGRVELAGPLATGALAVVAGALLVAVRGDWYWAAAVVVLGAGLSARASHAGALDWLVPAALRAAEYLFVIGVGIAAGTPRPVTFVLLFALALHHYDLTARPAGRGGGSVPAEFGWDGRLVLLTAATASTVGSLAAAILSGYLWLIFVVQAVVAWFPRRRRPRREDGSPPRPTAAGSPARPTSVHSRAKTGRV